MAQPVKIPHREVTLQGDLTVPDRATGLVVFAHGTGSSRRSPRNRAVAEHLQEAGFATLLLDLLTEDEEAVDLQAARLRFQVDLLAERLLSASNFLEDIPGLPCDIGLGYFGASTGAAAALLAAAQQGDRVGAVVSRGGRPDLAGGALSSVRAPTLLVVGGRDEVVLGLNRQAAERLTCRHELVVVPGATHLFEEPGALTHVAELAASWFREHLRPA
jgi:putative phosphoribosyl transferase